MKVKLKELDFISGSPADKRFLWRVILELLLTMSNELLDRLIEHVNEKRANKQP